MLRNQLGKLALAATIALNACDTVGPDEDITEIQDDSRDRIEDAIEDEVDPRCSEGRITRELLRITQPAWGSDGLLLRIEEPAQFNVSAILNNPSTGSNLVAGFNPQNYTMTACVKEFDPRDVSIAACGTTNYRLADPSKPFEGENTTLLGLANSVNAEYSYYPSFSPHSMDAYLNDELAFILTPAEDQKYYVSYMDEAGEWVECTISTAVAGNITLGTVDDLRAVHGLIAQSPLPTE